MRDLVVLPNGKISASLTHLLSVRSKKVPVYKTGMERFESVSRGLSLLFSAPLEEAYLWVLSCRAALKKRIRFNDSTYEVKCTAIEPHRIFPRDDPNEFIDVSTLEPDVMYFADEPGRDGLSNLTHPRADMFFRTTNGKNVVLIDVTGGKDAATKAQKLGETIAKMQEGQPKNGITVHGVVLAPADTEMSETKTFGVNRVNIVRGQKARFLLGGLDQIFQYMT
jgi:hypothetical protein